MMQERISGHYLIDNKIEFSPEFSSMTNKKTQQEIKLKKPASLCLELLLLKHNSMVPQNELMAFAWGEKHRQVPFNAFYQSILAIRKGFTFLGVETTIIQTIPRKGLIIPESVDVTFIAEMSPHLLSENPLIIPDETNLQYIPPSTSPPEVLLPQEKNSRFGRWGILAMLIVCAFTISILFVNWIFSPDDFFKKYTKSGVGANGCEYYLNSNSVGNPIQRSVLQSVESICRDHKILYITTFKNSAHASIIACDIPISTKTLSKCHSYFYPVLQDENHEKQ